MDPNNQLIKSARNGDLEGVKEALSRGADINFVTDYYIMSALHHAVIGNHIEIAKFLLENGADVDMVDGLDSTRLISAVQEGNIDMIRLLLKYNADTEIENISGDTALSSAVHHENKEAVLLLINNGADFSLIIENFIDRIRHLKLSNSLSEFVFDFNTNRFYVYLMEADLKRLEEGMRKFLKKEKNPAKKLALKILLVRLYKLISRVRASHSPPSMDVKIRKIPAGERGKFRMKKIPLRR